MTSDELMDLVTQYGSARADSAYAARDGDERESARRAGVALDALAAIRDEVESKRDQLRDAANDLLDVRGILSPAAGEPVTPLSLVPTVAPAVQWLADRLAAVEQDRDRLSDELAKATDELTVVRRERSWLLANIGYDQRQEFRLLAQTAEDAAPDVYCTACGGIALCVDGDWTHEEPARNGHQAEPPEDDGTCTRCGLHTVDGDGHWVACERNPLAPLTGLIGIAPDRVEHGTEAGQ